MVEINNTKISYETLMLNDIFNDNTKERAKSADILFLPDFEVKEGIDRAFQPDTIGFYKYSREVVKDYKLELFENIGEEKILNLHSFDIWIPTIFIASELLLPFIVNLVSNYVYDKLRGRESDEATIHFQLIIEDKAKKKSKSLFYKGPQSGFKESFEKVDISHLWKE